MKCNYTMKEENRKTHPDGTINWVVNYFRYFFEQQFLRKLRNVPFMSALQELSFQLMKDIFGTGAGGAREVPRCAVWGAGEAQYPV